MIFFFLILLVKSWEVPDAIVTEQDKTKQWGFIGSTHLLSILTHLVLYMATSVKCLSRIITVVISNKTDLLTIALW